MERVPHSLQTVAGRVDRSFRAIGYAGFVKKVVHVFYHGHLAGEEPVSNPRVLEPPCDALQDVDLPFRQSLRQRAKASGRAGEPGVRGQHQP